MITSLRLERFGAFVDREFPFSSVTLFVGPNESGKTTIVDALYDALCCPKSNRNPGKRLARRYGTDRDVSAEFDGERLSILEDAFYDLFAIRSGELTLNVKPGSSWVEVLKAELFTAGLDPKRLHAALIRRASTDGGSRHNRELRQLREEQDRLDQRRGVLADRAASARAAEAAATGQRSERTRVAAELGDVTNTLEERQRQAIYRLEQAEKREAEWLLQRFDELSREPAAVLTDEVAPRLQELSVANDAAAQEVTRARAELEQARAGLQEVSAGTQAGRPSWAERGGSAGLASIVILALFAGVLVCSAILIVGLPEIAAATAGVAAAGGTVAFFASVRQRAAGVAALRDETDRTAERLRVRRERNDCSEQELRRFLQSHGAESKEQMLLQIGSARAEEARRHEVASEIAAAAHERGLPDINALRDVLCEQLRSLSGIASTAQPADTGVLPSSPYPPADEESLRARVEQLRDKLEQIDEQVASDREKAAALSSGTAEIAELDARRASTERYIAALELDRRAAGIAASLFAQIADESTAALDELSADIGERYTAISGTVAGAVMTVHSSLPTHGPDRELPSSVHLEALEEEPLVTDAYGTTRPADQLSAGTRDAYNLAARLTLAERAQPGQGLLILDEPFHAMDTTHMRRALRLVARFQERTGWQLVILTADERVALMVTTQFTDTQIHRLTVRESRGRSGP